MLGYRGDGIRGEVKASLGKRAFLWGSLLVFFLPLMSNRFHAEAGALGQKAFVPTLLSTISPQAGQVLNRLNLEEALRRSLAADKALDAEEKPGDDSYSLSEDTLLSVAAPGLLRNDGETEGSPGRVKIETLPLHGRVELGPDGSFNYLPERNFTGVDAFSYSPIAGTGSLRPHRVFLLVQPVQDTPSAGDDFFSFVDDGTSWEIHSPGVLENDVDGDGEALKAVLVTPPEAGRVVLSQEGGFRLTVPSDFSGTVHFSYRALDTTGLASEVAWVNVNINSPSSPPNLKVLSPLDGAPVSGVLTVRAKASDDRSVEMADLYVDGVLVAEGIAPEEESLNLPLKGDFSTLSAEGSVPSPSAPLGLVVTGEGRGWLLNGRSLSTLEKRFPLNGKFLDDGWGKSFVLSPKVESWLLEDLRDGAQVSLERHLGDGISSFRIDSLRRLYEMRAYAGMTALFRRKIDNPGREELLMLFKTFSGLWDVASDGTTAALGDNLLLVKTDDSPLWEMDHQGWNPVGLAALPKGRVILFEAGPGAAVATLSDRTFKVARQWGAERFLLSAEGFGRVAALGYRSGMNLLLVGDPMAEQWDEILLTQLLAERVAFLDPQTILVSGRAPGSDLPLAQRIVNEGGYWNPKAPEEVPEGVMAVISWKDTDSKRAPSPEAWPTASGSAESSQPGFSGGEQNLQGAEATGSKEWSFRWTMDTRNWKNGLHELKVVVYDDEGLSGAESLSVASRNLSPFLSGERVRRGSSAAPLGGVRLTLETGNPDRVPVGAYRLERRYGNGAWERVQEVKGTSLAEGPWELVDSQADGGERSYRVVLLGGKGEPLALSNTVSL